MTAERTYYEYRFRFGADGGERKATPWLDREITAADLAEWQEDLLNVTAERRLVTLVHGAPESYQP